MYAFAYLWSSIVSKINHFFLPIRPFLFISFLQALSYVDDLAIMGNETGSSLMAGKERVQPFHAQFSEQSDQDRAKDAKRTDDV